MDNSSLLFLPRFGGLNQKSLPTISLNSNSKFKFHAKILKTGGVISILMNSFWVVYRRYIMQF